MMKSARGAGVGLGVWVLVAFTGFVGTVGVLAWVGGPHGFGAGLSTVLYMVLRAGTPAAVFLLGAIGLGRLCLPIVRGWGDAAAMQGALGLGLMLTLCHGLGVLGLLRGEMGSAVVGGLCVLGLALLAHQIAGLMRAGDGVVRVSAWAALGLPAVALLLVAAANTPGWLWDSEAGGYDALSYHLQLPQEWLMAGRIKPLEHNVYSYLPGYVESAFYAVSVMTGESGGTSGRVMGMVAGEGLGVMTCQMLSAGIAVMAAWMVGRLVRGACLKVGCEGGAGLAGVFAAVFMLSTPWTVVVGSLAYNDLGVVLFFAAATMGAMEGGAAWRRGLVCGALVGCACGCKPTALFMAGLPVGVVMVAGRKWKEAAAVIGTAAAGGLVMVVPWLLRNWVYAGNPVFPVGASVFGAGHWSAEQLARYGAGHAFGGGVFERVRMLVWPDAAASAMGGTKMRGILHPQWFAFGPVVVAATVAAVRWRAARSAAVVMVVGLVLQVLAWMFLTHLQSRFLLPLLVPGCVLVGLGLARGIGAEKRVAQTLATAAGLIACLLQVGATVVNFVGQRGGEPNGLLTAGPGVRTGEAIRNEFEAMAPGQQREVLGGLGPEQFVNFWASPGSVVYLLGDATPLYFRPPVLYNTTWDRWPLGEAIAAAPGEPAAWTRALRERGVRLVLVNFAELERLRRSGWADPRITPEALKAWLERGGVRPIKEWQELGSALFELVESAR